MTEPDSITRPLPKPTTITLPADLAEAYVVVLRAAERLCDPRQGNIQHIDKNLKALEAAVIAAKKVGTAERASSTGDRRSGQLPPRSTPSKAGDDKGGWVP